MRERIDIVLVIRSDRHVIAVFLCATRP